MAGSSQKAASMTTAPRGHNARCAMSSGAASEEHVIVFRNGCSESLGSRVRRSKARAAIIGALALLCSTGCYSTLSSSYDLTLSPNGDAAAYLP